MPVYLSRSAPGRTGPCTARRRCSPSTTWRTRGTSPPTRSPSSGSPWHLSAGEAGLEFHGGVSFMKGGLLFAELITTVSPQYARETQGTEMGLRHGRRRPQPYPGPHRHPQRRGLRGMGPPQRPPHRGSATRPNTWRGRRNARPISWPRSGCRGRRTCRWSASPRGWSARKGFDIVVRAWYDLLERPIRMVVLGSGEPDVQDGFRALAARAPIVSRPISPTTTRSRTTSRPARICS